MATAAQPKLDAAVVAPTSGTTMAPVVPLIDPWVRVEPLPCLLTVEISVPDFTVADLVHMESGRIIATRWTVGQDVPLRVNGVLIAWSEFEVVQNLLAVRLTELA
jgi:flagellar motor switch/type III secretory pathway protein FliN